MTHGPMDVKKINTLLSEILYKTELWTGDVQND